MFKKFAGALAAVLLSGLAAAAQTAIGFGGVPYDREAPVEVTAESLTVDSEGGTVVFEGDVLIVQGDMRMSAGSVTVYYDAETAGGVTRVEAAGGVTVSRGADAAEGETAEYDVAGGMMTLSGGVLVTQGNAAISGERLVVNMETGNGTITGRVRTVLSPESNQ